MLAGTFLLVWVVLASMNRLVYDNAAADEDKPYKTYASMNHALVEMHKRYVDQDSEEARMIRERCFTRLTPGQLLDTTMDKMADSIAVDSTGDGKVDKIVKLAEAEKLD